MSKKVDIWTVVLVDGVPVMVHGSARVSEKRVVMDPFDHRFGPHVEYATKGHGDVFGRGARTAAPDHWFSREAALRQWNERVCDQICGHSIELEQWRALADAKVTEDTDG